MNLQKEFNDARNYHINLHVEYTELKNAYERQVNVTEDEWRVVEKFGLSESVNRVISKFWEDIEFITTAFFDILELLNKKDNLEKSILMIWKSQLNPVKQTEVSHEEVVPSSDDGVALVPGYLEFMNSQLVELRGRIKWVEYNLMKYKFAASHGPQLKAVINQVLKGSKKHHKWPKFHSSWRHQNRKLEEEVDWYRKRLKFFREDFHRIKSVHRTIFEKYLTPEDQKQFPSKTYSLETRLKGNPTNYPGSWIETSRHSGLTSHLSGHSSTSGNTVLPWTISMAGPSRLDCASAINGNQQACKVECVEQRPETKVEDDGRSEEMKDQIVNGNPCNASEADRGQSRESPDAEVAFSSAEGISQCYGDGGRKPVANSPVDSSLNSVDSENRRIIDGPSTTEVVKRTLDDRDPFLKDEGSKTDKSTSKTNNSTNPFDDDEGPGNAEVDCEDQAATKCVKVPAKPSSETPSTRQPSSESSYESAEEIVSGTVTDIPSKVSAETATPGNIPNRVFQCSSLTQLSPSVYVPSSLPLYGDSSSAMRHVNAFSSTSNVPQLVNNYELLFLHETQKPPRNVLKKLFGKKK